MSYNFMRRLYKPLLPLILVSMLYISGCSKQEKPMSQHEKDLKTAEEIQESLEYASKRLDEINVETNKLKVDSEVGKELYENAKNGNH